MKLDHNMQAIPTESPAGMKLGLATQPSLAMSASTSLRPIEAQVAERSVVLQQKIDA